MEPDWDVIPLPANKYKKKRQSAHYKKLERAGGRKILLQRIFQRQARGLLVCKLAIATHCKRYKPSDRSDLVLRLYATLMEPDWDVIPLPANKHKKSANRRTIKNGAGNGI